MRARDGGAESSLRQLLRRRQRRRRLLPCKFVRGNYTNYTKRQPMHVIR